MSHTKEKFEVHFNDESGTYYVERLVYMSLPDSFDEEFETIEEAQDVADELNKPLDKGKRSALLLDQKENNIDYLGKYLLRLDRAVNEFRAEK